MICLQGEKIVNLHVGKKYIKLMKSEALKHAMYYGLIIGGALILRFLLGLIPSPAINTFFSLLTMVIMVWLTYKFSIDCRDKIFDGVWGYGRAFWYILRLAFYGSLICSIFVLIYSFIFPSFLSGMIETVQSTLEQLADSGLYTEEMVEEMNFSITSLLTPQSYSAMMLISNLFCGFITGLIMAAIVKEDNPFAGNTQNDNNE